MDAHNNFLPFEAFLELLQEHGFAVGVGEHLRLRQLLDNLPQGTDQSKLKSLMSPLFARSPQDQRLFYRLFDYHFGQLVPLDSQQGTGTVRTIEDITDDKPWIFPRLGRGVFALLGLAVAIMLGGLIWMGFQAYRDAPDYLRSYYVPNTFKNKLEYTTRDVFGMKPLCGRLKADFAYQGALGDRGRWQVQFQNKSRGKINRYAWDFGGINKSEEKNPAMALQAGKVAVCLSVYGNRGCRQVSCKNIVLGADNNNPDGEQPPKAYFTYTQLENSANIVFQDSSILGGRENIRFRWLFGDGTVGDGKSPEHRYAAFGNYTVRLQLLDSGNVPLARSAIRIQVLDPNQQAIPSIPLVALDIPDISDLNCSPWQRYATPIKWILFFALLSALASFILYRENKKLVARRSPRPTQGPYSFHLKAPADIQLYDQHILRETARQLRRRRESEDAVFDIPATVEATVVQGGYPQFQYRSGSQPAEYLVLIDRVCHRDHQAHLFTYITQLLAREDILLDVYYYQRNPDLFWKKVDAPPVVIGELAALYPNHRLVVLGDAQHFIDAVSGDLTEHAYELLNWEDKAILSPSSTADWGYREATLAQHFRFMPATIIALRDLVEQFRKDEPTPLRSWLRDKDIPTPLKEDDPHMPTAEEVAMLKRYLGVDAFNWISACALYPEVQWEMSMHIGQKLMDEEMVDATLFGEETLMKVCRLAFFRKGLMRDPLRLALAGALDPQIEEVARKAILEVIEAAKPPENTVAAYQHDQRWTLQQWELRSMKGKPKRDMSVRLEDMLRRGEVQDPVALHFLQTRKAQPLDFMMPDSWRKVLYPKGISMLGAKARLIGLLALPLLIGLMMYEPPNPQEIEQTPQGTYVCLQQATDSARYLDYLGSVAYQAGEQDPQSYVQAYNYFNDAASKQVSNDALARISYHRGLAALATFRFQEDRSNLQRARDDFKQAVLFAPFIATQQDIDYRTIREEKDAGPATFEQIRPDGAAVLRVLKGQLSMGNFDATYTSGIDQQIQLARFASSPVKRFATVSQLSEVKVWDYNGNVQQQLPAGIHQDVIRSLAFSPSGNYLATTSDDRTALIWDLQEKKSLQRLSEHRAPILDVAFSPDDELIVTAGADGVAIVTEVQTGIRVSVLVGHRGAVRSADVHPLGGLVVTSGLDSTVRVWDMYGNQLQEIRLKHGVFTARFAHTGNFIITVNGKSRLELRDAVGGFIRELEPKPKPGELPKKRSDLRALSQTTGGTGWLASFGRAGIVYQLPVEASRDSLLEEAMYAFALAAYTDRQFKLAIQQLSNMLSVAPEHADAYLLRGLSYLFQPAFKLAVKRENYMLGLADLERARSLDPALIPRVLPGSWVSNMAAAMDSSLQTRLCDLWPSACEGAPTDDPGNVQVSLPSSPALFDSLLGENRDGIIPAMKEGKAGFVIGKKGRFETLIPFQYEEVFDFNQGLAAVRQNGKWGFIDTLGQQILVPQYDGIISRPSDTVVIACVEQGERSFCIDRNGNCTEFNSFSCEAALIPQTKPSLLPKTIKQTKPTRTSQGYIMAGPYSEGLAPVREGDRFGYVDKGEKVRIAVQFEQAGQFYNGRARVMKNGKRYFIDKKGNCIETAGAPCP